MASPARCQASAEPSASPEAKRRPSLLPAFEPLSSSPLPVSKRKFDDISLASGLRDTRYYPTPVPTSSTGLLPSSPNRSRPVRPTLQRTVSELQQRAPLGAMPEIEVPLNGEPILLGRSHNSSDVQFSTNRLVSRIHISAQYLDNVAADHPNGQVTVECLGWNGAEVHYASTVSKISKGQVFTATRPDLQLIVDVCDSRVLLQWPSSTRQPRVESPEESASEEELAPVRSFRSRLQGLQDPFMSSPPAVAPQTPPKSDDNAPHAENASQPGHVAEHGGLAEVQIYEDSVEPEAGSKEGDGPKESHDVSSGFEIAKGTLGGHALDASFHADDFSDHNEENDPVVHSFGPFGQNLLPRFASINTAESFDSSFSVAGGSTFLSTAQLGLPEARPSTPTQQEPTRVFKTPSPVSKRPESHRTSPFKVKESPVKNHAVNQLAYSRLHSIPLSTILGNLPLDLKTSSDPKHDGDERNDDVASLTCDTLKQILQSIPCVGEISREGKDAAGKPLENEYYYVPELDQDHLRRDAVTGGVRGTGLRAVRKNHKQYYWKRPRH